MTLLREFRISSEEELVPSKAIDWARMSDGISDARREKEGDEKKSGSV
jgi:hypothetical protein